MKKMPLKAPFLPPESAETKTLWIFGAGATVHLGFPMSWGFLRSTIQLITKTFKEPNPLSVAFSEMLSKSFKKPDGSLIKSDDFRVIKSDPVVAFDLIEYWTLVESDDQTVRSRLQYLIKQLRILRECLLDIGISMQTGELLDIEPENLINKIRKTDANAVFMSAAKGRTIARIEDDIIKAQNCIRLIYFYSLSEFNEIVREEVSKNWQSSCYETLVRAFLFEKNSRIISFNYDTVLDEALFRCFTKTWAYERIHLASVNGYPVASGPEADLLYIKPHGSLNMLVCPNCQRTHIQWFSRFIPRGPGNLAASNRRCSHCTDPLPDRKELLEELVVPPLYDKEIIEGSKAAIRRAFAWANNIVSIGFSFPNQDAYFLECMADGLRNNPNSQVSLTLVLRGESGTRKLKQKLEADDNLKSFIGSKLIINATNLAGFETV